MLPWTVSVTVFFREDPTPLLASHVYDPSFSFFTRLNMSVPFFADVNWCWRSPFWDAERVFSFTTKCYIYEFPFSSFLNMYHLKHCIKFSSILINSRDPISGKLMAVAGKLERWHDVILGFVCLFLILTHFLNSGLLSNCFLLNFWPHSHDALTIHTVSHE